ncbi:unnamed protein product [Cuscuta europaea]|uniref:Uncharacterized protein n=1 Tax=Cuscuta europaea TaxID=41803 RepID=A0A9P0ZFM3_CUSEU|nr:unnamed protein product [Cuscuta europaea]
MAESTNAIWKRNGDEDSRHRQRGLRGYRRPQLGLCGCCWLSQLGFRGQRQPRPGENRGGWGWGQSSRKKGRHGGDGGAEGGGARGADGGVRELNGLGGWVM